MRRKSKKPVSPVQGERRAETKQTSGKTAAKKGQQPGARTRKKRGAAKPTAPGADKPVKKVRRPGGRRRAEPAAVAGGPERLQKLLARAGYGSRRACEELIEERRVSVDGEVVTELGTKADLETQDVRVDGNRLQSASPVYYLANKPKGVVCTTKDPGGRPTVVDLVRGEKRRIFAVGRLDAESRGAIILTNDGAFANMLAHPRYGIEKTYNVRVRGQVDEAALERLRQGVWLSEGKTLPAKVWVIKKRPDQTELGLAIYEGKNRQVRRMLAKVGHKVLALTRTRLGPLTLRGLAEGAVRTLKAKEVEQLARIARENAQAPGPQRKGRGSRGRSLGKPDPANPPIFGEAPVGEARH